MFGPDGGPTTNARMHLAIELERSDRLAEARVLWEQVLDASRRHRGPDSPDVLLAEELLAINLVKSGMTDDARRLFAHVGDARESGCSALTTGTPFGPLVGFQRSNVLVSLRRAACLAPLCGRTTSEHMSVKRWRETAGLLNASSTPTVHGTLSGDHPSLER